MDEPKLSNDDDQRLCCPVDLLVVPGDCLLKQRNDIVASKGTYVKNGFVYSSLAGYVQVIEETVVPSTENDNGTNEDAIVRRVITVSRPGDKNIPFVDPGSIVTCRVLRITSAYVKCCITCVGDSILKQPYTGVIRSEDIHESTASTVARQRTVNKCFRPGDILLARVIAAGENHQFLLSTASPELGVVVAVNDYNEPMIPISIGEVLDQRTLAKESRKVASIDLIPD